MEGSKGWREEAEREGEEITRSQGEKKTTLFILIIFFRRLTVAELMNKSNHDLFCKLYDTIRYDTRCYFNVRSKAEMSRLNPMCTSGHVHQRML